MKAAIKIFLFMLIVSSMIHCKKENEIEVVNISDQAFLNALIESGVDTNGDGKISTSEAKVITYLDVSGKPDILGEIKDLNGIEAFINLDTLDCSYNQLISLNVSNNKALVSLRCGSNLLSALDIANNTLLMSLYCWGNQISILNVSYNTRLKILDCDTNELSDLDVSNNTELRWLYCARNQLSSLDLSNNSDLEFLWCIRNQISDLNIAHSVLLENLWLDFNLLTLLDISANTQLKNLWIGQMPTLNKVCVWEIPFPPAGVNVDTTGSPNVYFTNDCN
jgi:Leucine-rich repeat (LRR) protein